MLLLTDDLRSLCRRATIYLDTNAFIHAFDQEELLTLYESLASKSQTAFVTLSSVEYEFTRGARSLDELNTRREFVRGLVSRVMPVNQLLESDKNDAFSVVMSTILSKNNSQYTDYLLAVALYKYNHTEKLFVLSADIKAFPDTLFTVAGVVTTISSRGDIIHLHLIELDFMKYVRVLKNIQK